jgi:poly(3-hydroxybutyrate) depolymerase
VFGDVQLPAHPGAAETVTRWAKLQACGGPRALVAELDLEPRLPGAETEVTRYSGCRRGVELWTVRGGNHFVGQGTAFVSAVARVALDPEKG